MLPLVFLLDLKKWGIIGIGLMPWDSKMYNILKQQDTLYTVLSRGHTGSEARVVGSIVDFMFAPENHQAVIDKVGTININRRPIILHLSYTVILNWALISRFDFSYLAINARSLQTTINSNSVIDKMADCCLYSTLVLKSSYDGCYVPLLQ